MKSIHPELTQRFLFLIKIDSTNLMNRIEDRKQDYLNEFSLKRDREVFKENFQHRYAGTSMQDLAQLPLEIIELANDFYTHVDELLWYLLHTQDMPNTIEEEILRKTSSLQKKYQNLILYIDVELKGEGGEIPDAETEELVHEDEDTKEFQLNELTKESTDSFKIEEYDLEDDS